MISINNNNKFNIIKFNIIVQDIVNKELRIKLRKDKFNMSMAAIIIVYYGELNCKYYEKVMNVTISGNEGKNGSKGKKK